MEVRRWIDVEGAGRVSGALTLPEGGEAAPQAAGVALAHGAGGHMDHPFLVEFARGLAGAGHPVLRFNFPYAEAGRRAPDRPPLLAAAWEAAFRSLAACDACHAASIVAAGKSMGGRIASELAAAGRLPVEALVLLGYPLHPAGRPERLRDAPLYRIRVPMLFFSGTRDPLCGLDLLRGVLARVEAPHTLEVVEGGDHSFQLPRAAGVAPVEVCRRLARRTAAWLAELEG